VTPREEIGGAFVALVLLAFGISYAIEHRQAPTLEQAITHERTAQAETIYVERKAAAVAAKVSYRTLRDTLLTTLTDTLLVKQVLARADTTIVRDSTALAAAEKVIASKDIELRIALKPRSVPRLRTTVAALYSPIEARYSASADASFRVIGGWALLARVDAPIGERPRIAAGVLLAF
jgi:hypothetical protein